jgi:hypothetical protein
MATEVRQPAVAGHFYPGQPESLLTEIRSYTDVDGEPIAALGCVVPHAGYMYSGHVAGAVYARLVLPTRFLILCPNHTGAGRRLAIMSEGSWVTPLGEAQIDTELAEALKRNCDLLEEDSAAHRSEHASEVQLPFLQALVPEFSFVPIAVGVGQFEPLRELGLAIAETLQQEKQRILVVASSDMNHYEPDDVTRIKDGRAIERMLDLDPEGLYEVVVRQNITMCGFGPAVAMLTAAKGLGANKAQLIKYATSGDISGDRDTVVGYAGIAIS